MLNSSAVRWLSLMSPRMEDAPMVVLHIMAMRQRLSLRSLSTSLTCPSIVLTHISSQQRQYGSCCWRFIHGGTLTNEYRKQQWQDNTVNLVPNSSRLSWIQGLFVVASHQIHCFVHSLHRVSISRQRWACHSGVRYSHFRIAPPGQRSGGPPRIWPSCYGTAF